MRALRLALFVLPLTVLGACDAGDPEGEADPLVGAWALDGSLQRTLVTVNETQEIVDRMRPGTGDLRITGAAQGAPRYAALATGDDGRETLTVFTIDPHVHPFPARYAFLGVNEFVTSVIVWRDGEHVTYSRGHGWGERPYRLEGHVLTMETVALAAATGDTVTVSGSLSMPLRTLEAGVEAEVERQVSALDEGEMGPTYVFERDGSFEIRHGETYTGTWERLDAGRVRATVTVNGDPVRFDWTARMEDDRLFLGSREEACEGRTDCFDLYERQFALAEESLARVRRENGELFVPAGERP